MNEAKQDKASMLMHSDEVFANAQYMYSTPDYDNNPNVYRWNYFYSPVQIGDEVLGVRIAIRDITRGASLKPESQIYNWGIKKDAPLGGGGRGGNSVASLGASSGASNSIIPNSGRIVNDGQAISNVELLSSMATRKLLNQRAHEFADKMTTQTRAAQEGVFAAEQQTAPAAVKNTEQGQEMDADNDLPSSYIDNSTEPHTPEQQKRIREFKSSVDDSIVAFVNKVRSLNSSKEKSRARHIIQPVTEAQAQEIAAITGLDVSDYDNIMTGNSVGHIDRRHGKNGQQDHSMADINDMGRISYVLNNFDEAYQPNDKHGVPKVSTEWNNSDGTPAPIIVFTKKIDGTMYVAEAAPDSSRKVLVVQSAYIQKNNGDNSPQVMNMSQRDPHLTSQTPLGKEVISDSIIPNSGGNVNDGQAISNVELLANMASRKLLNQRAHEFADKMTAQARGTAQAQDGVFAAEQQTTPAAVKNTEQGQELDVGDDYIHAEHHGNVLDGIRKHFDEVDSMENVANLTGNEFQKTPEDNRNLRQKVIEFFNLLGNRVHRPGFGDIALNDAGVRDSLNHGYGKLKAATFASLPDVLRDGKVINHDPKYKGRGYESFLIAAPVSVDGERCYVGALVIKDANTQRYKVHEVLTVNKNGTQAFQTEAGVPAGDSGTAYRSEALASNNIIPNSGGNVNDGRAISNVEMLSNMASRKLLNQRAHEFADKMTAQRQSGEGDIHTGINGTQDVISQNGRPMSNVDMLAEILARDNDTMREPQKRELSDSPSAQDSTTSEKSESVEWNPAIGFETWTEPVKKAVYSTEYDIRHGNTEAGILYDRNGQFLFRQDGMNDMVRFNNQQLLLMKDGILTHNHPNGGCFSPDDINMLHHRNLGEVRAITSQGIYRLQSPEKWAKEIDNLEKIEKVYYDIDSQMSAPYYDKARKGELSFQEAEILGQEATVQEFCNRYGIPFQFDSWDSIWEASK